MQPFSQYLSPEWAHRLGVAAFKYGLFPAQVKEDPKILVSKVNLQQARASIVWNWVVLISCLQNTKLLNYDLNNPIGIAAGFDKHGDAVVGLSKLGFSIVEIGSITPEPQPGNEKPRVFRLPEDMAVINRYGFNSEGHDKVFNKINGIKGVLDKGLLGINLGKNKVSVDAVQDYISGIKKFSSVADYFVINISRWCCKHSVT